MLKTPRNRRRAINRRIHVSMKFRAVSAGRLTQAEITAWSSIQRAHAGLCSPFFCPEFTQLVASVRPNVEVAVLEDSGGPVGFFPFQRVRSTGWPVGSGLNDFQGLVAAPDLHLEPRELLRACGLAKWHFDNLVLHRSPFNSFLRRQADSHY